jgi:carbohydrate-binding DOMON domain-containing protein
MPRFGRNWLPGARLRHAFAVLAGAAVFVIALDGLEQIHARSQLQQLADNAAMAGVQALQDSAGQTAPQRQEAAIAASRAVTDTTASTDTKVTTSIAPIYVSVELVQTSGLLRRINGPLQVVGQAGYLAPALSDDQQQVRLYNRLQWNVRTARSD